MKENEFYLQVYFHLHQIYLPMKGFPRGLVLKQRHKVARKWAITWATSYQCEPNLYSSRIRHITSSENCYARRTHQKRHVLAQPFPQLITQANGLLKTCSSSHDHTVMTFANKNCTLPIFLFNHCSLGRSGGVPYLFYDCFLRGRRCLVSKFLCDDLLRRCAVPWFFCLRFLCHWRRNFVVFTCGCSFNPCCDGGVAGRSCTSCHRNAYNWQTTSLNVEQKQYCKQIITPSYKTPPQIKARIVIINRLYCYFFFNIGTVFNPISTL